MNTRFVILSSPRSGSTVFRLWLNSHPNIRCHDEVLAKGLDAQDSINAYFNNHLPAYSVNSSYDRNTLGYPNDDFTNKLLGNFLEDLFTNRERCGAWTTPANINDFHPITGFDEITTIGFKLMTWSLDIGYINRWLMNDSVKIIHLVRNNSLQQLISSEMAKKRKVWFSDSEQAPTTIKLNVKMLLPFFGKLEEVNTAIRKRFSCQQYIQVTYEDFCFNQPELTRQVCECLNVPVTELEMPTLKKLNTRNMSDTIENYDEVKKTLYGTRFERFLRNTGEN